VKDAKASTSKKRKFAADKTVILGSVSEAESYFKSPYWGLTYKFPFNPDPLCSGNNYDIYDEMFNDDQVKSVINIKKDMVVNTGWTINGENPEVNEFITKTFEQINIYAALGYSFNDILRDMLSAYVYGFAISEPIYLLKDGKYIVSDIKVRAPHSFKFYIDDKGNITKIGQMTPTGELPFEPRIFMHYPYQMEFGNPYGKSDLRAAYNAWKTKKFFNRFFPIYIEKFAAPATIGRYPEKFTDAEVNEFFETVKSLQHASSAVIPEDVTIDFQQIQHVATDAYIKGINHYNLQIARSGLKGNL